MLYVVGGQQASPRSAIDQDPSWYSYQKGIVLKVDTDSGSVETCLEYVSPEDVRGSDDPVLFKSGSLTKDNLLLTTQTEVLTFSRNDYSLVSRISKPYFNDVHHVVERSDGSLLVANTGLEMVVNLDTKGEVLNSWSVLEEDAWDRYDSETDYRKGVSTKPHVAHPNYVFTHQGDVWATRFEKRDAACLTDRSKSINIGLERVHDGYCYENNIYFTSVDSKIIIVDGDSLEIAKVVDLSNAHSTNTLLGWCRGLYIKENLAWVGFSRIRPTKFREALSWVRTGFSQSYPTHIACYDLNNGQCLEEIDLEPFGLNAVFSILPDDKG